MKRQYAIEPMAGGMAHFSNVSGKLEMVGFKKRKTKQSAYRMEEQIDGSFSIWPNTPQGFEDALFYRNETATFPPQKKSAAARLLAILNNEK